MFNFHPYLGMMPMLTNIFQIGWNHQLVFIHGCFSIVILVVGPGCVNKPIFWHRCWHQALLRSRIREAKSFAAVTRWVCLIRSKLRRCVCVCLLYIQYTLSFAKSYANVWATAQLQITLRFLKPGPLGLNYQSTPQWQSDHTWWTQPKSEERISKYA